MKWFNKLLATIFGVGTAVAATGVTLAAVTPEGKLQKAIGVGTAAAGVVGAVAGALMKSPLVANQSAVNTDKGTP